jgi:asparagine synthase (glutamine-hydrolysing)
MLQSVTRLLGKWLPGRWRLQLNTLVSSPVERWASLRRLMDEDARVKVVNSKWLDEWIPGPASELYEQFRNQLDPLTQLSYTELAGYLRNTLLRDTDNMSMAHALEVRPVLLDHVLAEFIFALPPEFKLQGQRGKRVFADAVKEILPEQIINRPKTGFEMPLMDWMTGVLGERALAAFASSHANTIFTPAFLSTTRKEIVSGERLFGRPIHRRLWAYFILLEYLAVNQCVLD